MNAKKWMTIWSITILIIIPIIGGFNYFIDPYGIYNTKYFNFKKIKQSDKMRLVKTIKIKELQPTSICLGTSRTEYAYDPTHKYFTKPSYNLAISGSSMYENMLNFQYAIKQGKLKKVLLVVDYIMFNDKTQKSVQNFETYFDNKNIYSYLFTIDTLQDSLLSIKGTKDFFPIFLANGQREHLHNQYNVNNNGGHLQYMKKNEKLYYKGYPTDNRYKDTKKKSFPDFEKIVKVCYRNNIELDIIFGPSHIRQWEALNYYLGYDKWIQWKKDIVLSVNKIAKQEKKKQFRIMDFSVYHQLTAEKIPTNKNIKMKYYWESSHYKNELGLIVLDRLMGESKFYNFGIELNLRNIDTHLKKQELNRGKFIDVEKYKEDFEVYLLEKNTSIKYHQKYTNKDEIVK